MDFTIESSTLLADGSTRYIIRVLPAQLVYFGFFIEAFEGMCLYTTPQKANPCCRWTWYRTIFSSFRMSWRRCGMWIIARGFAERRK